MEYKDFEELVLNRQSCRAFSDKEVEKEKLEQIINLSMNAPSACNSQPWQIYCAHTPDKVKEVRSCLQVLGFNKFLNGAKAFIAVAEKEAKLILKLEDKVGANRFVKYDVGEYIAYVTLSAKAIGLETCIIGLMDEEKLAKTLGLAKNEKCKIVIAVGYSDCPIRAKKREPIENKVKYI